MKKYLLILLFFLTIGCSSYEKEFKSVEITSIEKFVDMKSCTSHDYIVSFSNGDKKKIFSEDLYEYEKGSSVIIAKYTKNGICITSTILLILFFVLIIAFLISIILFGFFGLDYEDVSYWISKQFKN